MTTLKWMRNTFLFVFQGCWCWTFDYDPGLVVRAWPILNFCVMFGMYVRTGFWLVHFVYVKHFVTVFKSNTNKVIFISLLVKVYLSLVLYQPIYTLFFQWSLKWGYQTLVKKIYDGGKIFYSWKIYFIVWNDKCTETLNCTGNLMIEMTSCIFFCIIISKLTVFISLLWRVCMIYL